MASSQEEELGQSDAPLARLGAVGMEPKEKLGIRDRTAFRAGGQGGQSSNLDKSRDEKTKKLLGERPGDNLVPADSQAPGCWRPGRQGLALQVPLWGKLTKSPS